MEYGKMLGEAFAYAKEGLVGKWKRWVLLLVATVLLALPMLGYELKILRGEKPAPEISGWGTLFIDGIKFLIIGFIYAIPIIILTIIAIYPVVVAAISGNQAAALAAVGGFLVGIVAIYIVGFIIALFEAIGIIRFARTGSMGEAFNFGEILATIRKIGWLSYIIALIIMIIVIGVIEVICMAIPFVGLIILFLLVPFIVMFEARYLCQVYDSAVTA